MPFKFSYVNAIAVVFCSYLFAYNDFSVFQLLKQGEPRFKIAVIECPGGTDKDKDGHRKDTHYLVDGLKKQGAEARVFWFTDDTMDEILAEISSFADAYVSRVDPGEYESCTEDQYFALLSALIGRDVIPFNSPRDMIALGAKKSLLELSGMYFFPNSTYLYSTPEELKKNFPITMKDHGSRVLKQNRGSKGEGVWWVNMLNAFQAENFDFRFSRQACSDGSQLYVKAVEAADNHQEVHLLESFMDKMISKYMKTPGDFVIDMEFLPRITEGEVRLILSGKQVLYVVDKQPVKLMDDQHSFSANLGAGASHVWQEPDDFGFIVEPFLLHMDEMLDRLGIDMPPILWTVDFIRHENDKFVISEINASCVGFSAHPELAEVIATFLLRTLEQAVIDKKKKKSTWYIY